MEIFLRLLKFRHNQRIESILVEIGSAIWHNNKLESKKKQTKLIQQFQMFSSFSKIVKKWNVYVVLNMILIGWVWQKIMWLAQNHDTVFFLDSLQKNHSLRNPIILRDWYEKCHTIHWISFQEDRNDEKYFDFLVCSVNFVAGFRQRRWAWINTAKEAKVIRKFITIYYCLIRSVALKTVFQSR